MIAILSSLYRRSCATPRVGPTNSALRAGRLENERYFEDCRLDMFCGRYRLRGLQLVQLFGTVSADCRMADRDLWIFFPKADIARRDPRASRASCCRGALARGPRRSEHIRGARKGAKLTGIDGAPRSAAVGGRRSCRLARLSEIAGNDRIRGGRSHGRTVAVYTACGTDRSRPDRISDAIRNQAQRK